MRKFIFSPSQFSEVKIQLVASIQLSFSGAPIWNLVTESRCQKLLVPERPIFLMTVETD